MDNVGLKKRTLCAANPRSRKATISSFFKSLALRFSFSVCCRTCLRVLFREGLVVLRVASVTLYDAGDADIFSVEGECSKQTRGRANGEMALFCCLEKVSQKNSSGVAGHCFCASFAFFTRFVLFVFALLHGLRMFEKNAFTTSLHLLSLSHTDQKTPQIILSKVSRDIKRTREELFSFSEREF